MDKAVTYNSLREKLRGLDKTDPEYLKTIHQIKELEKQISIFSRPTGNYNIK